MLRRHRLLLMQTKNAEAGDWPAVCDLLTEAHLPLDGAAEAFATGVVASDGDRLVGCAAIEPYDGAALLRSVAVVPDQQGTGVGTSLVHAIEDPARDRGATSVILLTETAEPWLVASECRATRAATTRNQRTRAPANPSSDCSEHRHVSLVYRPA
jgi:N-acetylglutamate synthase-like GNAT family acetyltransferase